MMDRCYDKQRNEKLANWHTWFAWYPVRLDSGKWRWLTYVGRRFNIHVYQTDDYAYVEYYHTGFVYYCAHDQLLINRLTEKQVSIRDLRNYPDE